MRIGFNPNFAPFSYLENKQPAGIVIERIKKILVNANVPVEFIPSELTGLIEGLMDGKFEVLAALAKTDERTKVLAFSKPIIVSGGAWFTPSGKSPLVEDELPKTVVTPRVGPLVAQISALYPEINIILTEDYDSALKDTISGEADAAALNWHVGKMLIAQKYVGQFHIPDAPFNTMPLYMASKLKNSDEFIGRLNPHIPEDWGPDPL